MLGSIAVYLLDLDRERLVLFEHAIRHHTAGLTSADPTIGTIWNADRLDLGRVGMRPRERFISTWAGRRRARTVAPRCERPPPSE
jgi:uncharacterized protein